MWLAAPPSDLLEVLAPLPADVVLVTTAPGAGGESAEHGSSRDAAALPDDRFGVVVAFCPDGTALRQRLPEAIRRLRWTGGLWVCWPKKSSPLHRDLGREEVREVGLAAGLVDNKVCAVDDDWSALRFVVRVEDRPESGAEGGPTPRRVS